MLEERNFGSPLRAFAVVVCILAASIAGACGSDSEADKGSGEDEIAAVIADIQNAYKQKDGSIYCENAVVELHQQAREQLQAKTCEAGFEKVLEMDLVEADIFPKDIRMKIKGDKAWATGYTAHTNSRQRAYFQNVDGEWKLAAWFRGDQKEPLPWVKGWLEEIGSGQ